jgi:UPF0755 protein
MDNETAPSCSRKLAGCLLSSLFLLCLASMAGVFFAISMLDRATSAFGQVYPGLSLSNHLILAATLLLQEDDLTIPRNPQGEDQLFTIQVGESVPEITRRLESEGLISSADAMRSLLIYSGNDTRLQAGTHRLNARMTALEIMRELQDATPATIPLTILPGWRMEEIAAALPTSGLQISPESFLDTVRREPGITGDPAAAEIPAGASMEGFLFPTTYELSRTLSANELAATLRHSFDQQVGADLRQGYSQHGLSLYQAVTLASIIEREAVMDEEMPVIASVFYNRLNSGMKLDSDPTVQYAIGYNQAQQTWWTNPLRAEDLKVQSPYNTYLAPGLPPGPISNPGLSALQAVASPLQTPYFYFRAACDGSGRHTFAQTLQEHIQNGCP